MKNIKKYFTSDLALSTTLFTLNFQPVSIDRSDLKKVKFIFNKNKDLITTIEKFWAGELLVEPVKFYQCLKLLKGRIYSHD